VLDEVLAGLGSAHSPSRIQLWPEHFDAGCDVAVANGGTTGDGERCNLGVSPGDDSHHEPYLYVGPWDENRRPGDETYWNASFGAVLRRSELSDVSAGVAFMRRGLTLLAT
jgi:hypothetical protein